MKKTNIKNSLLFAASLTIILLSSYLLFGVIGLRIIAGIFLLFFLPFYLILQYLDLEMDEKIFFSFFIGFGIFQVLVWYVDWILGSLRMSMLTTVAILYITGILMTYWKKRSLTKDTKHLD